MSGKGWRSPQGKEGDRERERMRLTDETNVGLNKKKRVECWARNRKRRRDRLWVKRLGEWREEGCCQKERNR